MATNKRRLLTAVLSMAIAVSGILSATFFAAPAVRADGETVGAKVINPIARYEFKDPDNIGKDSMGNYDMTFRRKYVANKEGELLDKFEQIEGGGIKFDRGLCLAQDLKNNMFEGIKDFTLCFEVRGDKVDEQDWGTVLGVGFNAGANAFKIGRNGKGIIFHMGKMPEGGDITWGGQWISDDFSPKADLDNFHKIAITVKPGDYIRAYVNGKEVGAQNNKLPKAIDENWTPYNKDNSFAIGASFNGNGYSVGAGSLKNVACYDFAMDAAAVKAYSEKDAVTVDDLTGVKQITAANVVFDESVKVIMKDGITDAEILEQITPATAELTISDGTEGVKTPVKWVRVEKEEGKYYAVGTIDTKSLGMVKLVDEVRYEISIASVTAVGKPVFKGQATTEELKDSMTEEEMLAKINTATVTLTLDDGSTRDVEVTFDKVVAELGKYTAYGDVMLNGDKIAVASVELTVVADTSEEYKEIKPVAKYEFKDPENIGKDSMGKYDMSFRNLYVAGGGGRLLDNYEMLEGGGIKFDRKDGLCLAQDLENNMFEGVKNFTLCFEIRADRVEGTTGDTGAWGTVMGVGYNANLNCFKIARFNDGVIFNMGLMRGNNNNLQWGGQWISDDFSPKADLNNFYRVAITVKPGDYIRVYVNGTEVKPQDNKLPKAIPADWTPYNKGESFAIGASYNGNGYDLGTGSLRNVAFYNFAMDAKSVKAYEQKGRVTMNDMRGNIVTELEEKLNFETEGVYVKKELTDLNSKTQWLDRLMPATVNAVLDGTNEDGSHKVLPIAVTWKDVKEIDGKYYAIGEVDPSKIGYVTVESLTKVIEVKQEVTVKKVDREIIIDPDIEYGTVTVDKKAAKLGESVVITVKAEDGYKLNELLIDDVAVEVGEDGTYTYVVTGTSARINVSAVFEETEKPAAQSGCGGCNSSMFASSALAVLAAAAVAVLKKKRG